MTPVAVLGLTFVVVAFGLLGLAAVLRAADRRRARVLDRWAADWDLRHHHVQIIELPKRGAAQ